MAGHSQFKNIMHRKGAQDRKKAKLFNKIAREITVSAKFGADSETNPRLRNAIQAAREANMPNSRIKSALDQASPDHQGANYEEVRYEGYGPAGVAVIIEALTDNRNRTAAEIRAAFTKSGGALGETNSVSFLFSRVGQVIYPESICDFDTIFGFAVEAGAENIELREKEYEILTTPESFVSVKSALLDKWGKPLSEGIIWRPMTTIAVAGDHAKILFKLLESLEENDDIQNVFANFEVTADDIEDIIKSTS